MSLKPLVSDVTMLQIQEPPKVSEKNSSYNHALWALPFRSFFLSAALASIVALLLWLAKLTTGFSFASNGLNPIVWHIHEMTFGFAVLVAVGFILTAVQTWTGISSITGKPVALLLALWFTVRLCFWFNSQTTIYLGLSLQAIWWIAVISIFSKIVFTAKNKRNYLFIPILLMLAICQSAIVLLDINQYANYSLHIAKFSVLLFSLLVTIIGGRIIPMFTANGIKSPAAKPIEWLEKTILPISVVSFASYLIASQHMITSALLVTLSIIHAIRMSKWQGLKTFTVPLLWSLHVAYLFMVVGLLSLGLSIQGWFVTASSAMHLITIGTIGLMIFAMMSRVSLGHTGRKLITNPLINISFCLLVLSAMSRVLLAELGYVYYAWTISTGLWCLAAVFFIVCYWKILSTPRF